MGIYLYPQPKGTAHWDEKAEETYLTWGGQTAATTPLAELKQQRSPLAFPPQDTG